MFPREQFFRTEKTSRLIVSSLKSGCQALLFITAVCIIVPFSPAMPAEGLDQSWAFAMNQALAQGLGLGREVVFTFGPYSFIYTTLYHPATDHLMIAGSVYLGFSYGLAAFLVTRNGGLYLLGALWVVLASVLYARDALLSSYPLLVGLYCLQLMNTQPQVQSIQKFPTTLTAVVFLPFGLLPLVKGTILVQCASITILAICLFAFYRQWRLAAIAAVSPIVSIFFFWIASSQSIADLPLYLISMGQIIFGYTEAMALHGNPMEALWYGIAALVLLTTSLAQENQAMPQRLYLFSILFVFLFLAFKAGFVRHDGHALIASTSLLFASLLVASTSYSRQQSVALLVSLFAWMLIDSHHRNTSTGVIFSNIQANYSSAWSGLKIRLAKNQQLKANFDHALQLLRDKAKLPSLHGTTDIYSYNQSYLIASKNNWNPRPIFQSYSAYTPSLAQKNKDHLLSHKAPDNIIFNVEPIDGRIPSLEDGASWPVLLTQYQPDAMEGNFLYLRKNSSAVKASVEPVLDSGIHSFGSIVEVPTNSQPIFVEIEIKQSIRGRLANILYKPSQLEITLNLENGTKKVYRLIAGMAKSGFVLSPLIENTEEFALLYGGNGYLADKQVRSLSITPLKNQGEWKDGYEVIFKKLTLPPRTDISKLLKHDRPLDGSIKRFISEAARCDGNIDVINGRSPAEFSATGLLSVQGWLAKSAPEGLLHESVFLVLKDSKGRHTFMPTRSVARPDVGAYFQQPLLGSSGYAAMVNVSDIVGTYTLGLAFAEGNRIKMCPQFKFPGVFKGTGAS